jgi:hypothetical protein
MVIAGVWIPEVNSPLPPSLSLPLPSCFFFPASPPMSSSRVPHWRAPPPSRPLPGKPLPGGPAPCPCPCPRAPRPGHALSLPQLRPSRVPRPRPGRAPRRAPDRAPALPEPVPRRPRAPCSYTVRVPSARVAYSRACDRSRATFNSRLNPF